MSNTILRTFLALLLSGAAWIAHAAAPGDALLGRWQPVDDTAAVITVGADGGLYQGRLSRHASQPSRVGLHVLRDLRYVAAEQRWKGRIYAVRRDRLMDASLYLDSPDQLVIEVHAWFGTHRVNWRRLP